MQSGLVKLVSLYNRVMKLIDVFQEHELDDAKILNMLTKDPIERNQQLNTFIGLLNSINKNKTLTIDGEWGSGKTVFVRQIDFLSRVDLNKFQLSNLNSAKEFQDKYVTYYYNAWENDYHEDPLQSILFNLINDFWGSLEKVSDKVVKFSKGLVNSVIKTTTFGLVDPQAIRNADSISDLVKSITTASDRKDAIDDVINNYLDLKGKKLLFIIDELDRCKPTFAVKLLEVVKHYYTNDKLVFLMSTNNQELAHTIKKVYGESFDGSGYLNKFYDLVFNLPDVKNEGYVKYLGFNPRSSYWKDQIPPEVATQLGLSLREINRYYSSLRLIDNYLSSIGSFEEGNMSAQLVKYIFIPLAYGLRIHNLVDYKQFVIGKGVDALRMFCQSSELPTRIITKGSSANADAKKEAVETIVEIYTKLFSRPSHRDNYEIAESALDFKRVVLLMNASGDIDESSDEESV